MTALAQSQPVPARRPGGVTQEVTWVQIIAKAPVMAGLPWVWWRLPRFDVRGTGWSRLGSVCTIWGVAVKPGNAVIADSQSGSGRSCQTAPVLSLWRSQR